MGSRILFAPAAVAVLLAVAEDARAYCRTTTSNVPSGYDPAASGCWPEGTPVAWTAGRVPYSLVAEASRQVTLADATHVAHLAFDAWNNSMCASGFPNVQAYDNGPVSAEAAGTDCGLVMCDPTFHDPQHVIVFRDDTWPHNDSANTLALTTVTYGVDSAEIFDADIEVNSAMYQLTLEDPPPLNTYNLQAILTHEAGHFFGLAHATDTGSIMYAFYKARALDLTQDDIDGVCSVYLPLPPPTGSLLSCGCEAVGSPRASPLRSTSGGGGPEGGELFFIGTLLALAGLTCRWRRAPFRWTRRTR
jgi:hypothetical protein